MVSVPMANIKFAVNEEKKIVTAYTDVNLYNEFLREMNKICKPYNDGRDVVLSWLLDIPFLYKEMDMTTVNDYYHAVGIARCAPEDEFDVKKGKELALTRMMDCIYGEWLKLWFETCNKYAEAKDIIDKYITKTIVQISTDMDRREDKIKDMFDDDISNENNY